MTKFLLEFHPKDEHTPEVLLHYNYVNDGGGFQSAPFSYGWLPLSLVDYDIADRPEFEQLCGWLQENNPSYQDALKRTFLTLSFIHERYAAR